MTTIKIKFESAEDLRKQMAALGFVPQGESVQTLKGGDLVVALERATNSQNRGVESAPAPIEDTAEVKGEDSAEVAAPVEEAPKTRKRRSKAEIEAEKNAAATKEEADETETPEPDAANDDTQDDDDDLTGEDDVPAVDIETLRGMIKERVAGGKKPEVIALFAKFGTDKLPHLAEEKYPAFYAELSKI